MGLPVDAAVSKESNEMENSVAFAEVMQIMEYGARRKARRSNKRGRRRGSRKKLGADVKCKLGDANLYYAQGLYKESISLLKEVVRMAPNAGEPYHMLGLVYSAVGDRNKALNCYMLAAYLMPKDSSLWKLVVKLSVEQGNVAQAMYCLAKAITADSSDLSLRFLQTSAYMELEDYQKAAESYAQISIICPDNIEALMKSSRLFVKCGKVERSIGILENYLKEHRCVLDVVDLLTDICMENAMYDKPIQHIETARLSSCSTEGFPLYLSVKQRICNIYVGNIENVESVFSAVEKDGGCDRPDLFVKVADAYMSVGCFELAIKCYSLLYGKPETGRVHLKIAKCLLGLNERSKAITHLYKSLQESNNDIEARLTLVNLLQEEGSESKALLLLLPPKSSEMCLDSNLETPKPWWLDGGIKLKLSQIYRARGMIVEFVDLTFPYVWKALCVETSEDKKRKRQSRSDLLERINMVDEDHTEAVFSGFRPFANSYNISRASRAKKLLLKRDMLKEEIPAGTLVSGIDWENDDSVLAQKRRQAAALCKFLEDVENKNLVIDLCKALATLERYTEALDIVNVTMKLAYKQLCVEERAKLQRLGAQIAYRTGLARGFNCVKYIVENHPYSLAAWNCYYRVVSRLEPRFFRHSKFLCRIRESYQDCVPSIVISGHQFTSISQHQAAAREYLEAYKLVPENPLINLCVGTALINLALGFRLQNKHQCIAQGFAFLFKNLQLCGCRQEALFNIGRACQHVGLLSLAVVFYEKVLCFHEKDYPIPQLPYENTHFPGNKITGGYCDLGREAAYNLHLIYKSSGANDLARQVLKDHCSF